MSVVLWWQDAAVTTEQWLRFLGRLHPLVLHLPIGLWIGVAALEFGGALVRRPPPRGTMTVLAWLAALTGAMAAASGWLLGDEGGYAAASLDRHRWFGVATAAAGLLAATVVAFRARAAFRLLLLVVLGVQVPASHFGGSLTHGEDFLTEPFRAPRTPAAGDGGGIAADPTDATGTPGVPPGDGTTAAAPAAGLTYANTIAPLFERVCTSCHGPQKHKAELRLDSPDGVRQGSENGPVLLAGKPDESPLVQRVELPLADEDHMPPENKPQPTKSELQLLRAWIAAGAPFEGTFAAGGAGGLARRDGPAGATVPAAFATAPGGSEAGSSEADGAHGAAAAPDAAALQALRERFVHVAELPRRPDEPVRLAIDVAAVATGFTDAEARDRLAPVAPFVAELGLARTRVGDATMELCARMPALRRLDVRGTAVTSTGVQHLRSLPRLETLVLAQTRVDDAAVPALLAMPALRTVWLWRTGVSAPRLADLRARQGLTVDAGDTPPGEALETEPAPAFTDELPLPGEDAVAAAKRTLARPVNATCPVTGKPVDARFVVLHDGRAVGFCCAECPRQFWSDPAKYRVESGK